MRKSDEEVELLNNQQKDKTYHPLTCCGPLNISECYRNKSYKERETNKDIPFLDENEGVLIATNTHWICPCGGYKQEFR